MAIVSSVIISQSPQGDGRSWIREKHIDQLNKEYFVDYMAVDGTDLSAILTQHAIDIWANLCENEIQQYVAMLENGNLPSPSVLVNNYATKLNTIVRLVKRALRMEAVEATYKALVLMNWVKANYNNTQIASFLGVNQTVVTAVMGRFSDLESKVKPLLDTDETKVVVID